ncbi:MAG: capsular biosynthesis protein [Pseudomonadota bacterium]
MATRNRVFLFLQGPHGPFFDRLARHLMSAGAEVWRVGFNAGDEAFWSLYERYIPYRDAAGAWPEAFTRLISEHHVSDLVLYGDTRPIHSQAREIAGRAGLTVHVFEEGYMRPFWVTYERGGSNGHSRLMDMEVGEMRAALASGAPQSMEAPAHWGDITEHAIYGALYHLWVLARKRRYPRYRTHRAVPIDREFRTYLRRVLLTPVLALRRARRTAQIKRAGVPYHLVLLQLEHDASFVMHSHFKRMEDFLELSIEGFATGAPRHHHLVFKAHPMESGRVGHGAMVNAIAARHRIAERVHYVPGGKLAPILDHARTAVTVNSTAAQQALWRGIPLKVFGEAVYAKPEFVSDQSLAAFFAAPEPPDRAAYLVYRSYLLKTSQIPGGFYSASGRRQLLRQMVDLMLRSEDPYDALTRQVREGQELRLVRP